jgi:hypothetical protein
MNRLLKNRAVLLLAGALLVWGACVLSWAADAPAVWSPWSLAPLLSGLAVVGLLASALDLHAGAGTPPFPVLFLFFPVAFAAWHLAFTRRDGKVSILSLLAAAELLLLCLYYLARFHEGGLAAHGAFHVFAVYLFNLLFWVGMFFAYRRNQDAPTHLNATVFHVLLFCWLGWVAFPAAGPALPG